METGGGAARAETYLARAKALACEQTEVYEWISAETPVIYEDGRLKSVEASETTTVAVRVVRRGRMGFAASSGSDDASVVDMAVRVSEFGEEVDLEFASRSPAAEGLPLYDPVAADYPVERMLEVGDRLVADLGRLDPGFLAFVEFTRRAGEVRVTTSSGQAVGAKGTRLVLAAGGVLVEPDNMLYLWRQEASRRADLDVDGLVAELVWLFSHARRNVTMAGGAYPVLFSPFAAYDLITPIVACLDGKAVAKGESPWKDKIGHPVFSPEFTLVDDPHRPWAVASTPFDDEGVPTRRRTMIDKGVLRDYNLDLRTGKALGWASTGSAHRPSPQVMPSPAPSNLVLEAGSKPKADLIAGIRRGLYVEALMGAWAGNPFSGQVSGNVVLGFEVRDGEITGRVKDCMVSVNVFDAFRSQLAGLSSEAECNQGGEILPWILIDGVSVSTKG